MAWPLLFVPAAFLVPVYSTSPPGGSATLVAVNGHGVIWPFLLVTALGAASWTVSARWRLDRRPSTRAAGWAIVGLLAALSVLGLVTLVVTAAAAPVAALSAIGATRATVNLPGPRATVTYGPHGRVPPARPL